MKSTKYKKYVFGSLVPLWPDTEDVPVKRVMMKIDCGPGRLQEDCWQF